MLRKAFLVIVAVFLAGVVRADDDPVGVDLDKAKADYETKIGTASENLVTEFERKIADVAQSGNLDAVKALKVQQEAFASGGKLPLSPSLRRARADYDQACQDARRSLEQVFDKTKKAYTKALDLAKAEAADQELKRFQKRWQAELEGTSKKSPATTMPTHSSPAGNAKYERPFQPGATYVGELKSSNSKGGGKHVAQCRLKVTSVTGSKFTGEFDRFLIEGTIQENGQFWFRFVKVIKGKADKKTQEMLYDGEVEGRLMKDGGLVGYYRKPSMDISGTINAKLRSK